MNMAKIPRGIRNNNPLNIRKGNTWVGERKEQTDPEFEEFDSLEFGVRAGIKLVLNYIDGRTSFGKPCTTIFSLISRWAPPSENNTLSYIATVEKLSGIHRYQRIYSNNRSMIVRIVQAMAKVETGIDLDESVVLSAWNLL